MRREAGIDCIGRPAMGFLFLQTASSGILPVLDNSEHRLYGWESEEFRRLDEALGDWNM